jgi:hypothetical protein
MSLVNSGAPHRAQQRTDRLARMIFIVDDQDLASSNEVVVLSFAHAKLRNYSQEFLPPRSHSDVLIKTFPA